MTRICSKERADLWLVFLPLVALFFAALPAIAQAQVIVVQSKVKGLKPGSMLQGAKEISIPSGKQVMFVLPSGATRTVSGPFSGKAAELTKGVKSNPGVFDAVKRYVVTGGANQRQVGALRSAAPAALYSRSLPFSWTQVPVTASGDYCVEKGAAVLLVRTSTKAAQTVTIVDMKSQRRVPVTFSAGKVSVSWPEELAIDPRSTYALLMAQRPMRQLRLRMIDPLPAREDTLQVLHGQRCSTQFRAYIREIQKAG